MYRIEYNIFGARPALDFIIIDKKILNIYAR